LTSRAVAPPRRVTAYDFGGGGGLFSSRKDSRGRRRPAHPYSTYYYYYYYTIARARVGRGPVTFLARDTRPWTEEPLKKIYTIIFSLK